MNFAGYELCLEPMKRGHYCHRPKGHRPTSHGQNGHTCSAACKHECNCLGMPAGPSNLTLKELFKIFGVSA
jgi:hypothetical protein